ncbi:MAG: aminopeptidase P family protein [SAR324 cluster bacterium]|nr:aminopeptidase P family protein [SAR324 cluster bacterium]MBL7034162.1 aminopeptidase P family protein [SAR324 cluster bacterium]
MTQHFDKKEFVKRQDHLLKLMAENELDGMLLFRQESMYYLSGYDTFGYVFFQCLYFGREGKSILLTRAPDLRQAQQTSNVQDIRIWVDGPEVNPALQLKEILKECGCKGKRLGVEYDSYGLTAKNGKMLDEALAGYCYLIDASHLVNRLRVVKSQSELVYVRKAAELADEALDEAHKLVQDGCDEGELLAAMQGAIFRGGGDYPANEFIIGSGENALLCRYYSGRRKLSSQDQLTLEWAGVYRHYHAAMMRTIPIGRVTLQQQTMHDICLQSMEACESVLRPGTAIGEIFDAYAQTCDKAGMKAHRLNATGYSLGTTFSPNWMDWPMLYHGNQELAEMNMVFFIHIILMDSDSGNAMCFGHTVLVTDSGCERLSRHPLDLVVR